MTASATADTSPTGGATGGATVIPLLVPPAPSAAAVPAPVRRPSSKKSEDKWGKEVWALGFSQIPSLLFHAQHRLGLSCNQMCVLLQLADFWWDADRKPFPKKRDIANRVRLSERQVQRIIAELEDAAYVKRIGRVTRNGKTSNEYDLSGLVAKLAEIAPEFEEAKRKAKEAKDRRAELALPLHRRRRTSP